MVRYIGIDPGVSGGIAVLGDRGQVLATTGMPTALTLLAEFLRRWTLGAEAHVILEHVWSQPGQGHSGAFTFGRSVGNLEGVMAGLGIHFTMLTPATWQRRLGCLTKGNKNISKARAKSLFPQQRVTHATADALLIATYCRQVTQRLQTVRSPRKPGDSHVKKEEAGA